MYSVSKRFTFAASHVLTGLPEGHQCGRLHGHNYAVTVKLTNVNVDDVGMVYDFGKFAPFKEWIDTTLDHRHLNDVLVDNPTAENLASLLWLVLVRMCPDMPTGGMLGIAVEETPTSVGEYYAPLPG